MQFRKSKKKVGLDKAAEVVLTSSQMTQIDSSSTSPSISDSLPQIIEEAPQFSNNEDTRGSRKRSWIWEH